MARLSYSFCCCSGVSEKVTRRGVVGSSEASGVRGVGVIAEEKERRLGAKENAGEGWYGDADIAWFGWKCDRFRVCSCFVCRVFVFGVGVGRDSDLFLPIIQRIVSRIRLNVTNTSTTFTTKRRICCSIVCCGGLEVQRFRGSEVWALACAPGARGAFLLWRMWAS